MWHRLLNFVFYNNGFVVILLLLTLSSSSVFAASPKAREGVFSTEEKLTEVDNSYIRDVDLKKQDFGVKVTQVEKDDDNYYVSYEFRTIELVDGAWKKVVKKDVLVVNIAQLADRDLGLYVAEELKELVEYTKSFLEEVQIAENKKGITQKTINKTYKGLVGRWLSPDEKTFAGYNPVIEPPVVVVVSPRETEIPVEPRVEIPVEEIIEEADIIENNDNNDTDNDTDQNNNNSTSTATSTLPYATSTTPTATTTIPIVPQDMIAPIITLKGQANVELVVGTTYNEAGATAVDNLDGDITDKIIISGTVDSSKPADYQITYTVSDFAGNQTSISRQIKVKSVTPPTSMSESTTTSPVVPENSSSSSAT